MVNSSLRKSRRVTMIAKSQMYDRCAGDTVTPGWVASIPDLSSTFARVDEGVSREVGCIEDHRRFPTRITAQMNGV